MTGAAIVVTVSPIHTACQLLQTNQIVMLANAQQATTATRRRRCRSARAERRLAGLLWLTRCGLRRSVSRRRLMWGAFLRARSSARRRARSLLMWAG